MTPGESHNEWYQYYCSNICLFNWTDYTLCLVVLQPSHKVFLANPTKHVCFIVCLGVSYPAPGKCLFTNEALPGVLGNRRKRVFISGEQGNKGQILRGTGEQRQYWGTGNIRKQFFYFWGTKAQANLFQGNKGIGIHPPPPLGGPH